MGHYIPPSVWAGLGDPLTPKFVQGKGLEQSIRHG